MAFFKWLFGKQKQNVGDNSNNNTQNQYIDKSVRVGNTNSPMEVRRPDGRLPCKFPYYDYGMCCPYPHYQCDHCEIKYKYINAMKNPDWY